MIRRRKRSVLVPKYIDEEVVIGDNGSAGVRFTCSYSRMIAEVAGEVEVPTMPIEQEESSSETVGIGSFAGNFKMTIHTPENIGGLINIQITSKSNIQGIYTNIEVSSHDVDPTKSNFPFKECKISFEDQSIFPIHHFQSEKVCVDRRIGTVLLQTPDEISITYKSFRFRYQNSQQKHRVMCTLSHAFKLTRVSIKYAFVTNAKVLSMGCKLKAFQDLKMSQS